MNMIDFLSPDWAYLLGVIHGDGSVSKRSICVSVGYKDQVYADKLMTLFKSIGYDPKIYRARTALRIDVHDKILTDYFRKYKSGGKWSMPDKIDFNNYLSGVFDTDGCVGTITNKLLYIGLKRSGNLTIIKNILTSLNVRDIKVNERLATFKGKKYEVEDIKITGMDRILIMDEILQLRHPKKSKRLVEMVADIKRIQSIKPLWQKVADYLKDEPRTWKSVAKEFNLSKREFDSVIHNIKRQCTVEITPPPEPLSRYQVKGQY